MCKKSFSTLKDLETTTVRENASKDDLILSHRFLSEPSVSKIKK